MVAVYVAIALSLLAALRAVSKSRAKAARVVIGAMPIVYIISTAVFAWLATRQVLGWAARGRQRHNLPRIQARAPGQARGRGAAS